MRDPILEDTGRTLTELNAAIHDALLKGRPADAADYATALKEAAIAYDVLDPRDETA